MYNSIAYIIYLALSLIIVLVIGKILHKNGKVFLSLRCPSKHLVETTNNLLYIGYCLVNIGYSFYCLKTFQTLTNYKQVIEFSFASLGNLILTLGIMHYINMLCVPGIINFFSDKNQISNNKLVIANPRDQHKIQKS